MIQQAHADAPARMSPHFTWHLMQLLIAICLCTMGVVCALYLIVYLQAELDPGVRIQSLDVKQVSVSSTHELVLQLQIDVRKGCVGRTARAYVRQTPGDPTSMDIQLVTEAPMVLGLNLADIGSASSKVTAAPGAVDAQHHIQKVREFIPSPSNLEPGGGWRIAELLSQEGCGYFHGLLPISTSMAIGPPIVLTAADK